MGPKWGTILDPNCAGDPLVSGDGHLAHFLRKPGGCAAQPFLEGEARPVAQQPASFRQVRAAPPGIVLGEGPEDDR